MTEISKLSGGLRHWMSENYKYILDLRTGKLNTETKQENYTKSLWKELEYKNEFKKGGFSTLTVPSCGELNVGELYQLTEEYGPYITTNWSQGAGFNDLAPYNSTNCPSWRNYKAPIGCVAVAMGQIMKYHQYPSGYNWSIMDPYFGTSETARMLFDAAESVNMHYQSDCTASWAWFSNIEPALKNTFHYSNAITASYNFLPFIIIYALVIQ